MRLAVIRGLWKLTWLESKIFMREPLGAIGTLLLPILLFIMLGKIGGGRLSSPTPSVPAFIVVDLPIFIAIMISVGAVMSLATIIAIYREGGILKRLRATPMRPHTILSAHVVVKLVLALVTLVALMAAGKQVFPGQLNGPLGSFGLAVLFSTASILAIGFVIASVISVARFVQPVGALVFYPMLALSGLFFPIDALPPALSVITQTLPLTHAVSLMRGIWRGDGWLDHQTDVAALMIVMIVGVAVSAKWFKWE
jgi:ABC-2 type transport system permease protein